MVAVGEREGREEGTGEQGERGVEEEQGEVCLREFEPPRQ